MANYIVGDIQGCYDALQRLLEKIEFDPAGDRLWTPGDVVNRGGQSLQTLRFLEGLGDRFVMTLGNHDLFLLRENWKYPEGGSPNRELDTILHAPDRDRLMNWLQRQPLAHWSSEHGILMVHAGVIPQWTLADTLACAAEVEAVLRSHRSGKFFARMGKNRARRWLISTILTRMRFCDSNGKILASASGPPGSEPLPY